MRIQSNEQIYLPRVQTVGPLIHDIHLPHVSVLDKRQTLFGLDSHGGIGKNLVSRIVILHLAYLPLMR